MRMKSEAEQSKRYARLTTAPVYPLLWQMAVPSMTGMMVASVYNMTDTYFIGKLGRTDLTAAVGIVFSFVSVIQAIGFWFGYGSGNAVSRLTGEKNLSEAEQMASAGCALAVGAGLVILSAGMAFIKPLAIVLGANTGEAVLEAVIQYLRITLAAVPFMLVSNVLYNQLRLQGSALDSMMGLLAGMFLNMVLDPLLILVFDMGVAGAAYASLAGQVCGTGLLFLLSCRHGNVRPHLTGWKPERRQILTILAGGAPNFCRQGISSVSGVVLNLVAGGFGESVIAGMTIALRLLSMGYALVIGFGQGFQPVCLINFGAGNYLRIKRAFLYAMITATIILCVSSGLFFCCGNDLAACFSRDPAVIQTASDLLRTFSFYLPFMAYYVLAGMLMQNIGEFGWATLITTMENGFFLIPFSLILPKIMGYSGLIWCKPAAGICALSVSMLIGIRVWKKRLGKKTSGPVRDSLEIMGNATVPTPKDQNDQTKEAGFK